MPQSRFDGRVAVVTGGSNGIGRAITKALADEGARVLVCDLADSGYFSGHQHVVTVTGDVAEHGLADRVLAEAVSRWGRADVLVNDAASYPDGSLLEMPADAWDRVFRVNVTGAFMMMQAFARYRVGQAAAPAAAGARVTVSRARPWSTSRPDPRGTRGRAARPTVHPRRQSKR